MEVFNKAFIHPVQYLLVTIALVIFYTLLVSISEHLPFNSAFIISASATLMLIGLYIKAILKSNFMAMILSGILFLLYSFVFVMLQIQDYALLIGSIGIFSILALIMYLSRKINWYQIRIEKPENSPNN
jgi:inner membrane protein